MQQGRKEVDDLDIGDEIEVADIDGEPAAGRVRNANGPGNTIVITGKGNEEHMIRKDSVLSTPMINIPESLSDLKEQYETALNEDDGVSIRRIKDGGAGRRTWQMRFEVGPLETMSHQDRSYQVSQALKSIKKGNRKLRKELENRMGSWAFEKMPTEEDRNGIIYIIMRDDKALEEKGRTTRIKNKTKVGDKMRRAERIEKKKQSKELTEGPGWIGEIQDSDIGRVLEVGDMITLTDGSYGKVEKILPEAKRAIVTEWGAGGTRAGVSRFSVPLDDENRVVQYPEGPHSPRRKAVDEDWPQEETHAEMVEYWKQSLSSSIVSKKVFTQLYDAANQNIDELNAAIADQAESIADSYHGSGEGIGSSDVNHFIMHIGQSLGIDDLFGWRKPKLASDDDMERDKTNRHAKYNKAIRGREGLGEDGDFNFFVDPQAQGANVMNSNGEIHDYYENPEDARTVAAELNAKYSKVDEGEDDEESYEERLARMSRPLTIKDLDEPLGDEEHERQEFNPEFYEEIEEMQRKAGIQVNEVKSGRFNSKAIGNKVKIIGQDDYGNSDHDGKIGTIISAEREHTFSQMVPFKIVYGVRLEDGARAYVSRNNIRKLKVQETASGGATGAGAIASSPAAMNGMQKRNPSIYGQTKLRKKPAPKKRNTSEDAGEGIGRSKKK